MLEPAADGGLGDRFAQRGHANFSHDFYPFAPSSSSAKADDPIIADI
jgi:hypothetical protein